MSMISAQCDELRRIADKDNVSYEASEAMYRAADIIWELRNKLAGVVDQSEEIKRLKTENAELKKAMDFQALELGCMTNNRDVLYNENSKLRESLEFANNEWEKDSLECLKLQAENDKLRRVLNLTLVRLVAANEVTVSDYMDEEYCDILRELGIEVDG